MGYEKVTIQNLYTMADQQSDLRMPVGGATGSDTAGKNLFNGDRLWNCMVYTLNNLGVGGGATGGSYTITVEGKIAGMSNGAPIARAAVGPNSASTVILDNLNQSPCSPRPHRVFIDQTATGGTINAVVSAMGKTYRGILPSGPARGTRVIEGTLQSVSTLAADRTDTISAQGNTASFRGLGRLRLWDCANFWVETQGISGSWEVDLIGEINGQTTVIASTGTGGTVDTANTVYAMANNFYGLCPRPSQIIWTHVSGAAQGITAQVYGIAKANRGQRFKN